VRSIPKKRINVFKRRHVPAVLSYGRGRVGTHRVLSTFQHNTQITPFDPLVRSSRYSVLITSPTSNDVGVDAHATGQSNVAFRATSFYPHSRHPPHQRFTENVAAWELVVRRKSAFSNRFSFRSPFAGILHLASGRVSHERLFRQDENLPCTFHVNPVPLDDIQSFRTDTIR